MPAIEAAAAELNARLAARGAPLAVLTHEMVCRACWSVASRVSRQRAPPSQWQPCNSTGGLESLWLSRWTLALALLRVLASSASCAHCQVSVKLARPLLSFSRHSTPTPQCEAESHQSGT